MGEKEAAEKFLNRAVFQVWSLLPFLGVVRAIVTVVAIGRTVAEFTGLSKRWR